MTPQTKPVTLASHERRLWHERLARWNVFVFPVYWWRYLRSPEKDPSLGDDPIADDQR